MKELQLFKKDGITVVSSRVVAEDFDKRHDNVMAKIEDKITALKSSSLNWFMESTYTDAKGEERKEYLLTRDGFSFIVMGFTGSKADEFKIKYIEAFNKMESTIQQISTDPMSVMRQQFLVLENHDEKINELENSVNFLIDTTRVSCLQEQELASVSKRRVIECCGGYESKAYSELSPKVFSRIGSDLKKYFKIPRRGELPKKDYDEGIEFLSRWVPNVELQLAIKSANSQMRIGA